MPPRLTENTSRAPIGVPAASGLADHHNQEPGERLFWADLIRACAIVDVLIIHCCVPFYANFSNIRPFDWWVCNLLDSFARAGVGLFVMLSGAFLLERNEPLSTFFKKRFSKVVIPFLAWQVVYAVWLPLVTGRKVNFFTLVPAIFIKPSYIHLWFPFMLIGLYLATPILSIYVQKAQKSNLEYFLLNWFAIASLAPIFETAFHWTPNLEPVIAIGYSGYFILGYYLRKHWETDAHPRLVLIAAISSALLTAFVTHFLSLRRGGLDESAYVYLSPNVVVLTVCVFLLLKRWASQLSFLRTPLVGRAVTLMSRTSFGVYLVHIIVLVSVSQVLQHSHLLDFAALGVPLLTICTLAISVVVVRILQEIPILRAFVP
jgi:surface polysaccharide O-acyltransferase-like enzyme